MPKRVLWVNNKKKPIKLTKKEKEDLMIIIKSEIEETSKLKNDITRIHIRVGRIYFYSEYELKDEGPYIDGLKKGDILEDVYGRITLFDKEYNDCTLNWQRHNDKWIVIEEGSLHECILEAESHGFFHNIMD